MSGPVRPHEDLALVTDLVAVTLLGEEQLAMHREVLIADGPCSRPVRPLRRSVAERGVRSNV